jgi:hypothetical protein
MSHPHDLLGGPPPTRLPVDDAAASMRAAGSPAVDVAAAHPADSMAWAELAEQALVAGQPVAAYAYARTGYHRGLDALRRNGWKGFGPVPADAPGNQGWLRAVAALSRAAGAIGEAPEEERCRGLLLDSDPAAVAAYLTGAPGPGLKGSTP